MKTNKQKYKTTEERVEAYLKCKRLDYGTVGHALAIDYFDWLALLVEDEKPEPCPFCGRGTMSKHLAGGFCVECDCGYTSQFAETEVNAIAAHNRVARAVRAAKDNEEVKGE